MARMATEITMDRKVTNPAGPVSPRDSINTAAERPRTKMDKLAMMVIVPRRRIFRSLPGIIESCSLGSRADGSVASALPTFNCSYSPSRRLGNCKREGTDWGAAKQLSQDGHCTSRPSAQPGSCNRRLHDGQSITDMVVALLFSPLDRLR